MYAKTLASNLRENTIRRNLRRGSTISQPERNSRSWKRFNLAEFWRWLEALGTGAFGVIPRRSEVCREGLALISKKKGKLTFNNGQPALPRQSTFTQML
jgi:hypothetical protein